MLNPITKTMIIASGTINLVPNLFSNSNMAFPTFLRPCAAAFPAFCLALFHAAFRPLFLMNFAPWYRPFPVLITPFPVYAIVLPPT